MVFREEKSWCPPAGDESEGGAPGGAEQEAAEDEAEPGRSCGEESDEHPYEQADPGSCCSPGQGGTFGGHLPGDSFNGSQVGADDLQLVDWEVLSGQAVDSVAGVDVLGEARHGVPAGHGYDVLGARVDVGEERHGVSSGDQPGF
jgi:hypothetical protein